VVATQSFAPDGAFEHTFSFDLSGNVNNDEYSVYIAGVAVGQNFNQAYAWPTGYSATTGKNAELTYWDFREVNVIFSGTSGRIRFENNPITNIDGALLLAAGEVNFANCSLGAETLADMLIGLDTTGGTGGTFNYSGNAAAPAERGLAAYNSLKDTKAWVLTGAIPADAPLYDADMQSKIDTANANAIAVPNNTELTRLNQRVIDYKATGGFAKDDRVFDLTGDTDTFVAFRMICIKTRTIGAAYGSAVWSASGLKGNATNAYFDPDFIPSNGVNYTLDSASLTCKIFDTGTTGVRSLYSVTGVPGFVAYPNNGTSSYCGLNGASTNVAAFPYLGCTLINRISASTFQIRTNGTSNIAATTTNLPSNKLRFLVRDTDGVLDRFSDVGIGFIAIGAEKSAEHAAIKTFLEAI